MANDVKIMSALSKEILYKFMTHCVVANTMNRQYDKTYAAYGANSGSDIAIKQIQRFTVSSGATIDIQDVEERQVTLSRSTQKHIALAFTSAELTQDLLDADKMDMFSEEYLENTMQTLAADIDSDILNRARLATYNTIGTPGTNPSSYADITNARSLLYKYNAPSSNRHYILTPDSMASLNAATSGLFNPTGEKSVDYRTGHLRDTNEFTFWSTDFLSRQENADGDFTTAAINGVTAEGASSIVLDGLTGTSVKAGSTITIADVYRVNLVSKNAKADLQKFIVTADATITAGAATLSISPALDTTGAYAAVDSLPADDAAVTLEGDPSTSYDQNLFYHRDAHVFATQDLAMIGANQEKYIRDQDLGISMKFTSDSDITNYRKISRLDILYGYAAVNPWWSGKSWGN